jgi:KipI family sensor histidine kinase inhibitor
VHPHDNRRVSASGIAKPPDFRRTMPLYATPRLLPCGDGAVTIQFGDAVGDDAHALVTGFVRSLAREVAERRIAGIVEWLPAYASVTVIVDEAGEDAARARDAALLALAAATLPATTRGQRWRLPVCFDPELAPDLEPLAASKGLRVDEVVAQLLASTLRVHMIGFMPGFPYMAGVPASLEAPRLASPRAAVPPRSVGLAGRMACIYPWASPGGWRLVGRTPVWPFDVRHDDAALLHAGDEVTLRAVDRAAFDALEAKAEAGTLERASLIDVRAEITADGPSR